MWPCTGSAIEHFYREKCESSVFLKERLVYMRSITLDLVSHTWYTLAQLRYLVRYIVHAYAYLLPTMRFTILP